MIEFATIQAAQKWLDMQPGHRAPILDVKPYENRSAVGWCVYDCQVAAEKFELARDGLSNATGHEWTRLKMAARRLSNALAYHYPNFCEPRRAKAA